MLKLKWESFRRNFYIHECSLGTDWSGWIVLINSGILKSGGLSGSPRVPFHERPGNSSGPESCFMFAVFAFKIKVSIILKKIVLWGYQLTKPSWLVCELGTVLRFNLFWFQNLPSGPKRFRGFRETGLWSQIFLSRSTAFVAMPPPSPHSSHTIPQK